MDFYSENLRKLRISLWHLKAASSYPTHEYEYGDCVHWKNSTDIQYYSVVRVEKSSSEKIHISWYLFIFYAANASEYI